MARPMRSKCPGDSCHVTSRGNEHKQIYRSKRDRGKFGIPGITGIGIGTLWSGRSCLMLDEQPLSSAAGNTGRQSIADHAAH
jgi:hypothetical protein